MSAAERISQRDWRAWFWHLWTTLVRGAAEGADAAILAATGGVVATGIDNALSSAPTIDIRTLWGVAVAAAAVAAIRAGVRFLKENPGPTGDEVSDDSAPPPTP